MVRWADVEAVSTAVEACASSIRRHHPEVSRILWYGSWVSGTATPSSDVDLCVVVHADDRRPLDRIPDYLPDDFPTGIDLFVLTEAEIDSLAVRSPAWHRAITSGKAL